MSYPSKIINGEMRVLAGDDWRRALERECPECGATFYVPDNLREGHGRYCSHICQGKGLAKVYQGRRPSKVCPICGDSFSVKPAHAARYTTCPKPECRKTYKSLTRTEKYQMKFHEIMSDKSRRNLVETAQGRGRTREEMLEAAKGEHARQALKFIEHNPGATVPEVINAAGYATHGGCYAYLQRAVKRGRLKSRFQDGRTRYYANNYVFADERKSGKEAIEDALLIEEQRQRNVRVIETPAQPVVTMMPATSRDWPSETPAPAAPSLTESIEAAAKDYAWEVNVSETTAVMKDFIAWLKASE